MAVEKLTSNSSFQIEIEKGNDSNGKTVFTKKTFGNVKTSAELQDVFDVAKAVTSILDVNTRNILLNESSKLVSDGQ